MQCLLMIVADRRRLHWQCCCSYFAIVWWKLRGGSKAAKTRVAFCQSFKIAVQMGASTVACRGGRVFCTRAHGLAYESGRRQLPQRTSTTNKQRRWRPSGLCCVACRRRDYVVFLRHASVGTRHRKRCAGRIASSAGGAYTVKLLRAWERGDFLVTLIVQCDTKYNGVKNALRNLGHHILSLLQ